MNKKELQSLLEGVRTALTGNQSKLDKNRNNKIDREDFTLLRSKKKPMAENADLLALLEHLYGVLLNQKAARLNEWEQPNSASHRWVKGAQANAKRGQTSDPDSFYQRNREDNDEIRMSIVRDAAKVDREEKEEQERQRRAKNENVQYDSIFEKFYNLLAEEGVIPPITITPGGVTYPAGNTVLNPHGLTLQDILSGRPGQGTVLHYPPPVPPRRPPVVAPIDPRILDLIRQIKDLQRILEGLQGTPVDPSAYEEMLQELREQLRLLLQGPTIT